MQNPWTRLPNGPPFVLDIDRSGIDRFMGKANPQTALHLELLPEPFLGNPEAPVVLLGLNPDFSHEDVPFHRNNGYFIASSRQNLMRERQDYPFYLLDPENRESPATNGGGGSSEVLKSHPGIW